MVYYIYFLFKIEIRTDYSNNTIRDYGYYSKLEYQWNQR